MREITISDSVSNAFINEVFAHNAETAVAIMERMPEDEAAALLCALPPQTAIHGIKQFQVSYVAELLKDAESGYLNAILTRLDTYRAASILMHLPEEKREAVSGLLPDKLKELIRELLTYPEHSVGRIMSTDFLSLQKDMTAQEAIDKIRAMAQKKKAFSYAYVIDDENHLIGVLNMHDLMIAPPNQPLELIGRKEVFSLHSFTELKEAAEEIAKRKYFAAPIIDSENHLLGIIKAERMIHGVKEDITGDMQRMFGAGGDERVTSSIGFSMRKRLPWLHVNLLTAFLAAGVVAMFEGIIAQITILAVFLPVVAGQGGNAGAQSLAVFMRGIIMREIPKKNIFPLILKEGKLGAINGAIIGFITALVAWVWYGNPYLGVVIGLGMLINLFVAGLSGASIPILMEKIGLDPAQCSSIILTTVTDVVGFIAFLGLAVLFQSFLV